MIEVRGFTGNTQNKTNLIFDNTLFPVCKETTTGYTHPNGTVQNLGILKNATTYFNNESEGCGIGVKFPDASTYAFWYQAFGLDPASYAPGEEGASQTVTASITFNGTTIFTPSQAFTFPISDDTSPYYLGNLLSPGNSVPAQTSVPGSLYTDNGQQITFAENTAYPITVTLYVTDLDGITRTLTQTRNIAWSGSYTI
jgi:hypothetical protein